MNLSLNLSMDEINGVLTALGQMPYIQAKPLIDKIAAQAHPQVVAAQAPAAPQVEQPDPSNPHPAE